MSDYIPQHLLPEEFVAIHKNQILFLHDEVDEVHAAVACLLDGANKESDGFDVLLCLVADKIGTLRDSLTPERIQNNFFMSYVEIRAKENNHV